MTSIEYELAVAKQYEMEGFKVRHVGKSNDYGVDIIAEREREKVAIQAKMYGGGSRSVNREMVFHLYAAKDYFDCTRAALVTDGEVLTNAREAALKLRVELRHFVVGTACHAVSAATGATTLFDQIWASYVKNLEGKEISSGDGRSNFIRRVDWSGVERVTSNGKTNRIEIEIFRWAVTRLEQLGVVLRDEINQEYKKRASSGVIRILSQVPMFELLTNPIRLQLKGGSGSLSSMFERQIGK